MYQHQMNVIIVKWPSRYEYRYISISMIHIIWATKFRLATHIQLNHVSSTLDKHFHHISKIHITCNWYWKILMFPNKIPPSDIYFSIIIIQLKSSIYNLFSIIKRHAFNIIQEHSISANISDTIICIMNNSTTIMT